MSRIREDYEKTAWRRLVHFINGDEHNVSEEAGYEVEQEETSVRLHEEFFEEVEWNRKKEEADTMISKYEEWPETRGVHYFRKFYQFMSAVLCVTIIVFLLITVAGLPEFGDASNPINNEMYERYVEKGMEETGAVNIVAGVILDYRAFDTLGESHVLFIATCCVMILLRLDSDGKGKKEAEENDRIYEPKNDAILQYIARFLVPIIMLYGIYVVFNGHISPGGGFSGGAIIGAGLILYLIAYGFKKTERFFTAKTFSVISVTALGFYSISKTYSFFTGANHLDSFISAGTPGKLLSAGLILPLNIAVGMVVACTMYSFYALFRKGGM